MPGFLIAEPLERGGFGWTYLAVRDSPPVQTETRDQPEHDSARTGTGEEERVVIKVARADRPQAADRLRREIAMLQTMGAPWVPAVFAHGALADGSPYLVMEYITAPTLADRLAASVEPFSLTEFGVLADAIATTLTAIHRQSLIHRDLKPEHVFLDRDWPQAKLIDFGLAKATEPRAELSLTAPDMVVGTAEYMAPEQCEAGGTVDARSDIYSFGVMLYEM
ncbi:MAG: serine/threonine-protein kinase, partial [Myxococcota bacterium]